MSCVLRLWEQFHVFSLVSGVLAEQLFVVSLRFHQMFFVWVDVLEDSSSILWSGNKEEIYGQRLKEAFPYFFFVYFS